MIRKFFRLCLAVVLLLAAGGQVNALEEDIAAQRSCSYCGMDRKAYGYSRMVIVYEDGASAGVCSLHCAVTGMQSLGKRKVKALLVADRDSRVLIDAQKAIWVMGGRKKGVMTQHPKWAFATKAGAESFIAAHGGVLADWETAVTAAKEEVEPSARNR